MTYCTGVAREGLAAETSALLEGGRHDPKIIGKKRLDCRLAGYPAAPIAWGDEPTRRLTDRRISVVSQCAVGPALQHHDWVFLLSYFCHEETPSFSPLFSFCLSRLAVRFSLTVKRTGRRSNSSCDWPLELLLASALEADWMRLCEGGEEGWWEMGAAAVWA